MKIESKPAWIFLALTTVLAAQSCSYFRRSEFATLVATDLTSIIDNGASEPDKRRLAQNENERKKLIQTLKQKYALAQAAEAEGLNKGERFQRELALGIDQLLATEYSKRNRELQVSKEELDAYFAAHKDAFESDFKVITANQKPEPSNEEKESFKPRWSEIKLRAEKGRQAGLEKEPGFGISVKINKAYLLAGLY
ncbi:MAG TPA: hypothetical protein VJ302_33960, partial [Blastocatellia bacterium]|nr:hypothetical protein [Blastocatellia bacterium]